jgi:hypothetical protein
MTACYGGWGTFLAIQTISQNGINLNSLAISNEQLAGLIDSGEGCLLLTIVLAIMIQTWWLLPIIAILGALRWLLWRVLRVS